MPRRRGYYDLFGRVASTGPVDYRTKKDILTLARPRGQGVVIPAKAGIQFDLPSVVRWSAELRLACGEPVTFFACAKKGNQRNTPPVARSSGILPYDFARVLRGSLDVRPCTFSERPRIVRGLLRTDPAHPRRASGGPFGRHPAAEATALHVQTSR